MFCKRSCWQLILDIFNSSRRVEPTFILFSSPWAVFSVVGINTGTGTGIGTTRGTGVGALYMTIGVGTYTGIGTGRMARNSSSKKREKRFYHHFIVKF